MRSVKHMVVPLSELQPGTEATIREIEGGHGFHRRLFSQGIVVGKAVRKLSALGWGGPVVVQVDRAQVAIGRGMARRIIVEPRRD